MEGLSLSISGSKLQQSSARPQSRSLLAAAGAGSFASRPKSRGPVSRAGTGSRGASRGTVDILLSEPLEAKSGPARKPKDHPVKAMSRARQWSPDVENEFRVQQAGWRHLREYRDVHDPQFWETGLIKMVVTKDKGYFTYWNKTRECEDKNLHTVKIFEFED